MTARSGYDRKEAVSSLPPTNETTFHAGTLILDVVEDILCRLPVKILTQLRCVCKSWNSLISDPIFTKKHLRRSRKQINHRHLISCPKDREFQLWDSPLPSFFNSMSTNVPMTRLCFPPNIGDGYYKVIGSCDGILCVSIGEYNNCVMLWNPSIKKFKILPPLENQPELKLKGVDGKTIYWHDKTIYGFGHDHVTDNYKVVALFCYKVRNRYDWVCKNVEVHTLGTNTWKTIQGLPSAFSFGNTLSKCGIFLGGTVNWLVLTFSPCESLFIFSFDLRNESYQELLPPDDGEVDVRSMELGVLRDCLCILSHTRTLVIHVWLMEYYGNKDSWTKLFVVTSDELFIGRDCAPACPLYILEDDQLLLDLTSKLVVYNSRNCTLKILKVESISDSRWLDNHVYIESLISPLYY